MQFYHDLHDCTVRILFRVEKDNIYMKLYILSWVLDVNVVDEDPYKRMNLAYYYNTKRILKVEAFKYS